MLESDSTPAAVVLFLALLLFLLTAFLEAGLNLLRREPFLDPKPTDGFGGQALRYLRPRLGVYSDTAAVLRMASAVATTVSAVALASAASRWVVVALAAVGVWAFLALLRGVARSVEERLASLAALSRLALLALVLLWPFAWLSRLVGLGRRLAHLVIRPVAPPALDASGAPEDEALPVVVTEEPLDQAERRMIRAILGLEKTTVREIMVPRVDIMAADADSSVESVVAMMQEGGHSRIPIYEGTIDSVVGIVHARDLVRAVTTGNSPGPSLRELARPPYFIPESKRADQLLQDMREHRVHIAVVVDEYGGTAGLVTIEDLLEEIVGELADEFEVAEPDVELVSHCEAVMDARTSLDDLNATFATGISGEGFDTVGGFVYHELGRIPSPGDEVVSDGLRLQVINTIGRRIKRVRVSRVASPPASEEEILAPKDTEDR
ncbi:MAG: HlyC/CorC family transporter [Chloroflexi bacterium]|nr:HlyC/CorC family transporter [Chloroflexota bacterium]